MQSGELQVERAAFTVFLRQALSAEYVVQSSTEAEATELRLKARQMLSYCPVLKLMPQGDRNVIQLNGEILRLPVRGLESLARIKERLSEGLQRARVQQENSATRQALIRRWAERQTRELSGVNLQEIRGLAVKINMEGQCAGSYQVSFEPGSVLEQMSLEEVQQLVSWLKAVQTVHARRS